MGGRMNYKRAENFVLCSKAERRELQGIRPLKSKFDGVERISSKSFKLKKRYKGECPFCGCILYIKDGKFGKFVGCINYPKCKFTKNLN